MEGDDRAVHALPYLGEFLNQLNKLPPMTPAQHWDLRLSFAYGNIVLSNPLVTREMMRQRVIDMYGPRPADE